MFKKKNSYGVSTALSDANSCRHLVTALQHLQKAEKAFNAFDKASKDGLVSDDIHKVTEVEKMALRVILSSLRKIGRISGRLNFISDDYLNEYTRAMLPTLIEKEQESE